VPRPTPAAATAFSLSSEIVDTIAALRPVSATYQGVPGYDWAWDDYSPSGAAVLRSALKGCEARLKPLPASNDRWDRLARLVAAEFLRQEIDAIDEGDPLIDLNNIASTFQSIRQVFDVMDTGSAAGWDNVIERLRTIHRPLAGYRASLEEGKRRGRVVARRQVRAVMSEGRTHAGDRSFFRTLPDGLRKAGFADGGRGAALSAAVEHACAQFAAFADWLERGYLPAATPKDGVGRARYLRNTRRFLGMDIDPIETYHWGWGEVRRIEAAMRAVSQEIKPGATLEQVMHLLKTDPARCASSPEDFRRKMLERQQRALADLDGRHFDIPKPIKKIDVKLAPPGGALAAYYVQPTEDFSRTGTVWYPTGDKTVFPLYEEVSTAYHEGFPGHHLQCGFQVALSKQLSRLHRLMVWYPGYGEGWALYAEQLMHELGYFEKPEYVLGMYNAQLFRACRVVIDIGSHLGLTVPKDEPWHKGEPWSYELGVEMMEHRAHMDHEMAVSEVTRYLGWPGQAISYKVGQREILRLREDFKKKAGSAFRLKEFHKRVVGSGPVGLALLRRLVLTDVPGPKRGAAKMPKRRRAA